MNPISIRTTVKPGDLSQITLYHAIYYSRLLGWNEEFEAYVAKPLAEFILAKNPGERIWIVEQDDRVKGCVALVKVSDDIAQLRWMFIEESIRHRGLGGRLMNLFLEFALSAGYSRVILWTEASLKDAIRLYIKSGFSLAEEKKHFLWGQVVTEQKFERDLSQSAEAREPQK